MIEAWEDIPGYDGLYQVSNIGRVRSRKKGVMMNSYISGSGCGYRRVKLSNGHKKKAFLVHRLVASAFIPNPNEFLEVNHIDGNKQNNAAENLEWCTHSENMKHAYRTRLLTPSHHFRHSEEAKRKISEKNMWGHSKKNRIISQFSLSGEFMRNWNGFCEIRKELGFHQCNIHACCVGKYKQSNGYIWRYASCLTTS